MKFSSMNTMLLAIALKQVSGAAVPADIALSERGDVGNAHYYPIAEHERGTVYSNVVPSTKKRSVAGHAVEERLAAT